MKQSQKPKPVLIVFGGLPAVGKTTLAKALSEYLGACYIRIDTIEHTLKQCNALTVGDEGYRVAYDLAKENLELGNIVIADSVNSIEITRKSWQAVAEMAEAKRIEVEVVCSDPNQHRSRVEMRVSDIHGFSLPNWQDVVNRGYEIWETKDITIDTGTQTISQSIETLKKAVGAYL